MAPPEALTQALSNLIGNAVDASPVGGEVRVGMTANGGVVEFHVTDCGGGLSEEVRVHAGEPFFTTKPPGRGMGLGLFLVRLLARRLAGELRFETPNGSGKWGPVPMIPFEGKVPPGDMQRLAGWILGYRWGSVLAD